MATSFPLIAVPSMTWAEECAFNDATAWHKPGNAWLLAIIREHTCAGTARYERAGRFVEMQPPYRTARGEVHVRVRSNWPWSLHTITHKKPEWAGQSFAAIARHIDVCCNAAGLPPGTFSIVR